MSSLPFDPSCRLAKGTRQHDGRRSNPIRSFVLLDALDLTESADCFPRSDEDHHLLDRIHVGFAISQANYIYFLRQLKADSPLAQDLQARPSIGRAMYLDGLPWDRWLVCGWNRLFHRAMASCGVDENLTLRYLLLAGSAMFQEHREQFEQVLNSYSSADERLEDRERVRIALTDKAAPPADWIVTQEDWIFGWWSVQREVGTTSFNSQHVARLLW